MIDKKAKRREQKRKWYQRFVERSGKEYHPLPFLRREVDEEIEQIVASKDQSAALEFLANLAAARTKEKEEDKGREAIRKKLLD